MKKMILLFLLFGGCYSLTKEPKIEPIEIVYTHQVQMDKAELRTKILSYISEKAGSAKSVIQVNEENIISGNINSVIEEGSLLSNTMYLNYSFVIKLDTASYKIKLIAKYLYDKNMDFPQGLWGSHSEQIRVSFDRFDKTLYNYITSKESDF